MIIACDPVRGLRPCGESLRVFARRTTDHHAQCFPFSIINLLFLHAGRFSAIWRRVEAGLREASFGSSQVRFPLEIENNFHYTSPVAGRLLMLERMVHPTSISVALSTTPERFVAAAERSEVVRPDFNPAALSRLWAEDMLTRALALAVVVHVALGALVMFAPVPPDPQPMQSLALVGVAPADAPVVEVMTFHEAPLPEPKPEPEPEPVETAAADQVAADQVAPEEVVVEETPVVARTRTPRPETPPETEPMAVPDGSSIHDEEIAAADPVPDDPRAATESHVPAADVFDPVATNSEEDATGPVAAAHPPALGPSSDAAGGGQPGSRSEPRPSTTAGPPIGVPTGDNGVDTDALFRRYHDRVGNRIDRATVYTNTLRRAEAEGIVTIGIIIDMAGDVIDIVILESSGDPLIDETAIAQIRSIRRMPSPPADLGRSQLTLEYRMNYRLES